MDALQFPDFPADPVPGQMYSEEGSENVYQYFLVAHGVKGGFWAYLNNKDKPEVVVDRLFDDNPRLAGRLTVPWDGQSPVWVLVRGWIVPESLPRAYIDVHADGRYERNLVDDVRFPKQNEENSAGNEENEVEG